MNRWLLVAIVLVTGMLAGCLPSPIGDPATSTVDPALEGTWLHDGLKLSQCQIGGVEYGPGMQKSIYLVRAFDEHCYLITAIQYYAAEDGRIGTFGPGGDAGLTSWKGWLARLGERRYLVCQKLGIDPIPPGTPAGWFPTFEVEQLAPNAVRITPVVFGDIFNRLEGVSPDEARAIIAAEYSREKLEARIRDDPDAAAPGDPRPLELQRMDAASLAHVERVLAIYHLTDGRSRRKPPQAAANVPETRLDGPYDVTTIPEDLTPPTALSDTPGPGKVFMDQIANPKFFPSGRPASPNVLQGHAVYLPTNWEPGRKYPVIFEYLGNTVGVQSLKGIGYGLSGGRDFIWVILPIVSAYPSTQPDVTVNWGNDVALASTVEYAKQAVREVCDEWGGDPANCVLVGNSRGGIACNLIGLYDDEIASLWKAMVPSAHYFSDGVDFTGTKVALGGVDYRAVAAQSIGRLGTIAQLIVAEYNTDILSGKPDAELIPKITATGYTTLGEAITAFKLKPVYDSSLTKTRAFVESHKPPTSIVVFYPLAWVNHGSLYALRHTPERAFIRTWLRQQVGLPASDENGR
jgi:hypothetical protein